MAKGLFKTCSDNNNHSLHYLSTIFGSIVEANENKSGTAQVGAISEAQK